MSRDDYYSLRAQARSMFGEFVRALNRRDTYDMAVNHARHPLSPERVEYLTAQLVDAHRWTEHCQRELDDYDAKLRRLERELGLEDDDDRVLTSRSVKATTPPGAQPSLFPVS